MHQSGPRADSTNFVRLVHNRSVAKAEGRKGRVGAHLRDASGALDQAGPMPFTLFSPLGPKACVANLRSSVP